MSRIDLVAQGCLQYNGSRFVKSLLRRATGSTMVMEYFGHNSRILQRIEARFAWQSYAFQDLSTHQFSDQWPLKWQRYDGGNTYGQYSVLVEKRKDDQQNHVNMSGEKIPFSFPFLFYFIVLQRYLR